MNQVLLGKFFINGKIKVETGLHIGGTKESLDIGGIDNAVISYIDIDGKRKIYVPGSSLKGKIRSLLEKKTVVKAKLTEEEYLQKKEKEKDKYGDVSKRKDGIVVVEKKDGTPCECGDCEICKIFGPHESRNINESVRIIVRDAKIEEINNEDGKVKDVKLEVKTENTVNRVKGTAEKPRETERVIPGTCFNFEIVFNVYDDKNDISLIHKFIEGMCLLEDDYLGGSGSRGYGKIKFEGINLKYRTKEYYEGDYSKQKLKEGIKDIKALNELLNNKNSFEEIMMQNMQNTP